ncbi:TetR/AcrR family transcriptional regulator [Actinocorallia sp. B10E7]|uniref:TetR/AcrR family transcriptional regulator n=1 Tax=Actinocorallia sp. B10E7 TaxID=3153558 RepID=UPI00325DF800
MTINTETSSREVILEAAERLMAERGYAATSISKICAESGLPVGSVYHHFGNKAGILEAVLERGTRRFYAQLETLTADPALSAMERMRSYYKNAPEIVIDNRHYLSIQRDFLAGADTALAALLDANNRLVTSTLARVIVPAAAEAGVPDPEALGARLARLSVTYAIGAMLLSRFEPDLLRAEMAPLLDVVLTAITAAAPQG